MSLGCCLQNEQKLLNSINHHQGIYFLSNADALLLERSERVSRLNLHCDGKAKRLVLSVVVLSWT